MLKRLASQVTEAKTKQSGIETIEYCRLVSRLEPIDGTCFSDIESMRHLVRSRTKAWLQSTVGAHLIQTTAGPIRACIELRRRGQNDRMQRDEVTKTAIDEVSSIFLISSTSDQV